MYRLTACVEDPPNSGWWNVAIAGLDGVLIEYRQWSASPKAAKEGARRKAKTLSDELKADRRYLNQENRKNYMKTYERPRDKRNGWGQNRGRDVIKKRCRAANGRWVK